MGQRLARMIAMLRRTQHLVMAVLLLSLAAQAGEQGAPEAALPRLLSGEMPRFPRDAWGQVEADLVFSVTTDGLRVTNVELIDYVLPEFPRTPILGELYLLRYRTAVEETVRTWEFWGHRPTTFQVKFRYRIADELEGGVNEIVVMRLPAEVEITVTPPPPSEPGAGLGARGESVRAAIGARLDPECVLGVVSGHPETANANISYASILYEWNLVAQPGIPEAPSDLVLDVYERMSVTEDSLMLEVGMYWRDGDGSAEFREHARTLLGNLREEILDSCATD